MIKVKKGSTRDCTIPAVRFTKHERDLIDLRCKKHGVSVSDYVRFCINYELENNK